ncbi:P-loop containing nucleoside triphosphate hydrolase [Sesbania bispinosa]|nr:P-loop containing nucleoside triphosphate hydrolase [Sesbania bispinosa]
MSDRGTFSGDSAMDAAANMEGERRKKEHKVPFLKLFSFADYYDCLAYLFPKEASHEVAKYSLDFVYLSIAILFSSWTEVACWMHTGERQAAKMRLAYLKSMLNQDISLFDTEASTGEVISAITSDIIIVQDALSEKVGNFMHYISRFIAGFTIGFVRVWQISLVTLSIVPLIALAGGLYAYVTIGLIAKVRKAYVRAGEIAEEVIGNVRTVQAFAGEERAVKSYKAALMKTYSNGRKAGLAKGLGLGSMHCVLFLSWALLVWFTSIVVHKNIANGGESFTTMLNVVISGLSLGQAAPDISAFIRAKAAAYPIFEMIERDTMTKTAQKLGEHIYGKDDATLEELKRAVKLSDAQSFINNLPDRLETQGDTTIRWAKAKDCNISCYVKNPSILLLDEATSALDAESEKSVQEALDRVMVGRTTVIVAHRLSTIRNADVIAVVQGGRIVETGNHEELISNPTSVYASLVQLQEATSLERLPSVGSSLGRQSSINYSRELSRSVRSFGGSFRSDKDSIGRVCADEGEKGGKPKHVSARRLYSMNVGLVVASFIIAFLLNWRITLVVIATYPLIISGHISEKLFMKGYGGNLSKAYLKANMLAGEAVSNIRTVAAFCSEEKILDLYYNELIEPSKRSFQRGQIAGIFYGISQFFIFSSYGLALCIGYGGDFGTSPRPFEGNQMVASVFEVMDRKSGIVCDTGEELKTVEGTIELRRSISTTLQGQIFYDPTSGKVLIDGKDITRLNLKSLRKHIGLVQQEPALFATSIYENILYGKEGASDSEVIEAAKLANAHNFISGLPDGYSTKVGERGVQLSGGQRQRVAIARAVLKNPEILLLDEATSAFVESERVVQQALDRLMQNRTTVMVAHRLSTIRNADQISVLQDGKIIEHGTHSSLIENKNGAYFK